MWNAFLSCRVLSRKQKLPVTMTVERDHPILRKVCTALAGILKSSRIVFGHIYPSQKVGDTAIIGSKWNIDTIIRGKDAVYVADLEAVELGPLHGVLQRVHPSVGEPLDDPCNSPFFNNDSRSATPSEGKRGGSGDGGDGGGSGRGAGGRTVAADGAVAAPAAAACLLPLEDADTFTRAPVHLQAVGNEALNYTVGLIQVERAREHGELSHRERAILRVTARLLGRSMPVLEAPPVVEVKVALAVGGGEKQSDSAAADEGKGEGGGINGVAGEGQGGKEGRSAAETKDGDDVASAVMSFLSAPDIAAAAAAGTGMGKGLPGGRMRSGSVLWRKLKAQTLSFGQKKTGDKLTMMKLQEEARKEREKMAAAETLNSSSNSWMAPLQLVAKIVPGAMAFQNAGAGVGAGVGADGGGGAANRGAGRRRSSISLAQFGAEARRQASMSGIDGKDGGMVFGKGGKKRPSMGELPTKSPSTMGGGGV
jgi:hypothetical protein